VDADDPGQGLRFDGRTTEDFKLATGTWVNVGLLRAAFIEHGAPYVRDVVIAGADRDDLAALVFPDLAACRALCPELPGDAPAARVLDDARVRAQFATLLRGLAQRSTGSSNRIGRALLLAEPPSLDAGEVTDKGTINQRAVLSRRAALVEELYADPLSPRLLVAAD
jgi:feruloyl-CoA synthase